MGHARSTPTTGTWAAGAGGSGFGTSGTRGECRKLFTQLFRTAFRAGSAFPIRGTDEEFAVGTALFAMKFVNWHGESLLLNGNFSILSKPRYHMNGRENSVFVSWS